MRCIPTRVRMTPEHPEFSRALCLLVAELRRRRLADGSDAVQLHDGASWHYLCSIPSRLDGRTLAYVHVFHHPYHPVTGEAVTLGIMASPTWWPDARCQVLAPRRSEPRARLQLVS